MAPDIMYVVSSGKDIMSKAFTNEVVYEQLLFSDAKSCRHVWIPGTEVSNIVGYRPTEPRDNAGAHSSDEDGKISIHIHVNLHIYVCIHILLFFELEFFFTTNNRSFPHIPRCLKL